VPYYLIAGNPTGKRRYGEARYSKRDLWLYGLAPLGQNTYWQYTDAGIRVGAIGSVLSQALVIRAAARTKFDGIITIRVGGKLCGAGDMLLMDA
jgi:hypothetical protein